MDRTDTGADEISTGENSREAERPVVLQVLPRMVTGGVERGTVDVTAALVDAGWDAVVVSAGGPMVREVDRAGGVHVTLPVHSKNFFTMRSNVGRLLRVIREHKVDIVHARSRAPAWSARAAARRAGVGFVTTFHGTYGTKSFLKRRYNAVMASGERVIAISEFIAEHLRSIYGVDPGMIRVIHRGIDVFTFHPSAVSPERMIAMARDWRLPDSLPVIMLPGRLTHWKGQEVLLDALALMGREDVRCLFVGEGRDTYRRRLQTRISRRKVDSIVQLIGECRDMPAAYMLADVVVSASTEPEAFGRVAVEAQALGKPVIATDHGGARETVIDGVTGWLAPPGDAKALAEALSRALSLSQEEREAFARRAIDRVNEHFTREAMCEKTLAVYDEVLAAHGRDHP